MTDANETDDDVPVLRRSRAATPGVILVWSSHAPTCRALPFAGRRLDIGRDARCDMAIEADTLASRRHAELSLVDGGVRVRDLESRNGTFARGTRVEGEVLVPFPAVVRAGGTLLLLDADVSRLDGRDDLVVGDFVVGAAMQSARTAAASAASHDRVLYIHGETGTGKEALAKHFHESGPHSRGGLVAINCGELSAERAPSELFGHKRGAFTGADRDHRGAFERANGGVLFLDEVGDLALDVQQKLLRVIQERTVQPLGSETAKRVSLGICCATHRDLPMLVADGRFREDLLRRIVERRVWLPPLRDRKEEIPFLAELVRSRVVGAPGLSPRFVEACLLREWRGNVRELSTAVESCAADALQHKDDAVEWNDALVPDEIPEPGKQRPSAAPPTATPKETERSRRTAQEDERVYRAVRMHNGDVAAAAKHLGKPLSTTYLALERHEARTKKK